MLLKSWSVPDCAHGRNIFHRKRLAIYDEPSACYANAFVLKECFFVHSEKFHVIGAFT